VQVTVVLLLVTVLCRAEAETKKKQKNKEKIGKDITDYTDADVHRLLDQWDENDDEYDPNDLDDNDPRKPQRQSVPFDPKLMASDPIGMMKLAKKGKPLMLFATVAGKPTQKETETISALWQQSLHNAQFQLTRYVIAENRVLIHIEDGSKAYDIKDFLVKQKTCAKVEFENQEFIGAGASAERTEL